MVRAPYKKPRKRTPIEEQVNRGSALLLWVEEVTPNEVFERYSWEDTSKNRSKLSTWKIRAGKKQLKLGKPQQRAAILKAREIYFGVISSAIIPHMQVIDNTEEIDSLEVFEDNNDNTRQNTTEQVSSDCKTLQNTAKHDKSVEISQSVDTNKNNEEIEDCKSLDSLKIRGAQELADDIIKLQNRSVGKLFKEKDRLDALSDQLFSLIPLAAKPLELKALVQAYECIVSLHRKMALLPFGSVNPNVQPAKERADKHLHLHNHGLDDFVPGEST